MISRKQLEEAVASLSTPDTVSSPFGDLRFFDGVPLPETVGTGYDALDTPNFTNFVVFRALGGVPAMKRVRVYPLVDAADPAPNEFINLAELTYAYTVHDANGDLLDGGRSYQLHVDADQPAKNFWAIDIYDTQTRSLLVVPSTPYPALASNSGTLQANDDGSYDLFFGPSAPAGKESNWIETVAGKSWFPLFRAYGPLEPWFNQSWRLNEFEPIE